MEIRRSYDRLISTMRFALLVRWRLYVESGSSMLTLLVLKLGPVSISEKTSYRMISWSLEVARFVFRIVRSLWNLTGTSAAVLPMCRCACQISKRYDNLKDQSRGFETLRDLTKRRLFGYWDGALNHSDGKLGQYNCCWWPGSLGCYYLSWHIIWVR